MVSLPLTTTGRHPIDVDSLLIADRSVISHSFPSNVVVEEEDSILSLTVGSSEPLFADVGLFEGASVLNEGS
mgnify:CR=1 FL=1